MKKHTSGLFVFVHTVLLIFSTAIVSFAAYDSSQADMSWALDSYCVLTISGQGTIEDYSVDLLPLS